MNQSLSLKDLYKFMLRKIMEKLEFPKLKITTRPNCESILNLFLTYYRKEIRQKERYYMQKIGYLQTIKCSKEIIWINQDRLNLLIYEEERRAYLEFLEKLDYNDDNNLDQLDIEY